jgi:hypothetical protein
MKIVTEQLWALVNAQKYSRPDLKLRIVRTDAQRGNREQLPEAYLRAFGARNTASGRWRYLPTPPFSLAWNCFVGWGAKSRWAIDHGADGGMTTRQMRDRWSRHSSIIPGNHMDNHRNGASCASYELIRFGAKWISRALGGWTPFAFLANKWKGVIWTVETRTEFYGWSMGCPCWYSEHQP